MLIDLEHNRITPETDILTHLQTRNHITRAFALKTGDFGAVRHSADLKRLLEKNGIICGIIDDNEL